MKPGNGISVEHLPPGAARYPLAMYILAPGSLAAVGVRKLVHANKRIMRDTCMPHIRVSRLGDVMHESLYVGRYMQSHKQSCTQK